MYHLIVSNVQLYFSSEELADEIKLERIANTLEDSLKIQDLDIEPYQ